jgi:hypothetical protein
MGTWQCCFTGSEVCNVFCHLSVWLKWGFMDTWQCCFTGSEFCNVLCHLCCASAQARVLATSLVVSACVSSCVALPTTSTSAFNQLTHALFAGRAAQWCCQCTVCQWGDGIGWCAGSRATGHAGGLAQGEVRRQCIGSAQAVHSPCAGRAQALCRNCVGNGQQQVVDCNSAMSSRCLGLSPHSGKTVSVVSHCPQHAEQP